ncbi:spore-associated protein A [Nocardiopsis sp. NPDC058631]|uniref:spore-associated protein A n=1 Tax=Nocardiopsis sp. NPDC058631 TaxID=3346566 RepID=UPI00365CA9AC
MNVLRAACAAAALAVAAGVLAVPPAHAAAAEYNDACGHGYDVVDQVAIGKSGTTFLTYNKFTGLNCAVTVRTTPGPAVEMVVGLKRTPDDPRHAVYGAGHHTTYAGPVHLYAAGTCVDWFGYIDGDNGYRNETDCG